MTAHSLRARFKATVAEAILDAAETIAAEEGVAKANLQAIAKRAGIAVGTIYNHFADRNELFGELFTRRKAEMLDSLDLALKDAGKTFGKQLEVFVEHTLGYFDGRRNYLHLALEGAKPALTGETNQYESLMQLTLRAERIVKLGLKEKILRPDVADLAPHFLTAAIRGVLLSRIDSKESFAGESKRVIRLFLEGAAR